MLCQFHLLIVLHCLVNERMCSKFHTVIVLLMEPSFNVLINKFLSVIGRIDAFTGKPCVVSIFVLLVIHVNNIMCCH